MQLTDKSNSKNWLRPPYFLWGAALGVFILIVLGSILSSYGDGGVCPDWPTCFGSFTPPAGSAPRLEYIHRLLSAALLPIFIGALWEARKRSQASRGVLIPIYLASALYMLQAGFGGAILTLSIGENQGWFSAMHLTASLAIQALLVSALVWHYWRQAKPGDVIRIRYKTVLGRLALASSLGISILLISGTAVSAVDSGRLCTGWPLCGQGLMPTTSAEWLHLLHRMIVLSNMVLVTLLAIRTWLARRSQPVLLTAVTSVWVLFLAQALMGAKMVAGYPAHLVLLHDATAAGVWIASIVALLSAGLTERSVAEDRVEMIAFRQREHMLRDLLALTKPIVVALLLVTTFAGMVIGAEAWPSATTVFWTLIGGFMAAGGSGAINQFIDRDDDNRMQRTQKRPIPSGRLTPGEGLAFGTGMALTSFYIVTVFVNFLAALLTLAGIIYYVLIYSLLLKKTTVQNIVIGGGAGAIPPLVGWAAATGSLNIPSLFLFAVIFMWTPPHFWALALVRRKDYARAGVPMLPVVRGETETRKQIFLYTLELVGLTLFLPLFGLGGSIYIVGAGLLGVWLISAAWRVWKEGGNKRAWKMYRYSSMYLAFLFVVMMVDALY